MHTFVLLCLQIYTKAQSMHVFLHLCSAPITPPPPPPPPHYIIMVKGSIRTAEAMVFSVHIFIEMGNMIH